MSMNDEKETLQEDDVYTYTYSARQREEIRAIQKKYLPREEDKMERLRELDRSVSRKGTSAALAAGIAGALVLGTGMSMTMVGPQRWFAPGIVIGLAGFALMGLAYPLYARITRRERERIAPEILRLSKELLK